jgi:hypothetical protein
MTLYTVIARFATRQNAEGFIREHQTRKNAKWHLKPLILILDPLAHEKHWLIAVLEFRKAVKEREEEEKKMTKESIEAECAKADFCDIDGCKHSIYSSCGKMECSFKEWEE